MKAIDYWLVTDDLKKVWLQLLLLLYFISVRKGWTFKRVKVTYIIHVH